ncbi:hypothetical protein AB4Z22_31205, partial [Paenibacillus sp. TAF58]
HDIPDGITNMTVTPSSGTYVSLNDPITTGDNPSGTMVYSLNISSAPYVIVTNLYNGKNISNETQLTCPGVVGAGPCISGKVVNLDPANYQYVELSVNDTNIDIAGDLAATPPVNPRIAADGTFTVPASYFGTLFKADGKKTIKFSLYLKPSASQPKVLVTQTMYEIFVLSDYAPLVDELTLDSAISPYKLGTLPGSYQTTSNNLQITGKVLNAEINNTLPNATNSTAILYVTKTPVGSAITAGATPLLAQVSRTADPLTPLDGNRFIVKFKLATPLVLDQYGDYIFELVAKNSSGRTTSKMITVTKQPVDYLLIQPTNFVKNVDNVDQANVNTNFQTVIIRADGADSVVYNKVAAKQTNPGEFRFDVPNLKAGKNPVAFEINRGTAKTKGNFVLNNLNTPIEGAQFITPLTSKMSLFGGDLQLTFPKDTKLM